MYLQIDSVTRQEIQNTLVYGRLSRTWFLYYAVVFTSSDKVSLPFACKPQTRSVNLTQEPYVLSYKWTSARPIDSPSKTLFVTFLTFCFSLILLLLLYYYVYIMLLKTVTVKVFHTQNYRYKQSLVQRDPDVPFFFFSINKNLFIVSFY